MKSGEGRAHAQHVLVLRRGRMQQQRRSAVRPADRRRGAARPQPGPRLGARAPERIAARRRRGSRHGMRTRCRSHRSRRRCITPWAISRSGSKDTCGQSVSLSDDVVHGDVQRGAVHQRDHRRRIERRRAADVCRFRRLLRGARRLSRKAISRPARRRPEPCYDDYSRMEDMLPLVRQYLTPGAPNPRDRSSRSSSTTGRSTIIS